MLVRMLVRFYLTLYTTMLRSFYSIMAKIKIDELNSKLSHYLRLAQSEDVVVTRYGEEYVVIKKLTRTDKCLPESLPESLPDPSSKCEILPECLPECLPESEVNSEPNLQESCKNYTDKKRILQDLREKVAGIESGVEDVRYVWSEGEPDWD